MSCRRGLETSPTAKNVTMTTDFTERGTHMIRTDERLDHDVVLNVTANKIKALRPLVALILSDQFVPDERKRLRHLVGDDGVFHLKNALARLCSEAARKSIQATDSHSTLGR